MIFMKKIQLFALLCLSAYMGDVQAKHVIDSIKPQKPISQRVAPPDSLSLNTSLREGLLQLKDDNKALKYDKKWLEELSNRSLFPLMQSDVENTPAGTVAYDELTTEVLKERLARLDQKTPFHIEYNLRECHQKLSQKSSLFSSTIDEYQSVLFSFVRERTHKKSST